MENKRLIEAGKLIYRIGYFPREIEKRTGVKPKEIEKLYNAIKSYSDENLTSYEIAQKVNLSHEIVREVLKDYFENCAEAYKLMLKKGGSRAWAAEQKGIARLYFEDFWCMCNGKYGMEFETEEEANKFFEEERKNLL